MKQKIGFIGAGNMAQAIGLGLINSGAAEAGDIIISAPSNRSFGVWQTAGVRVTHDNNEVIESSDIVFFSMKPQFFQDALKSLNSLPPDKLYVSILAGLSLSSLLTSFCSGICTSHYKIIRVMPNTPILVGAGCSLICPNENVTEKEIKLVKSIMEVGGYCEIIGENIFNSVSAVCGSGPAFLYPVIEALADGAVLRGVPRDLALRVAAKTMEGAGKLVLETGKHPGQLKDEVCSPGGMTIVGVHQLEQAGVRAAFINAVKAAAEKADDLGRNTK